MLYELPTACGYSGFQVCTKGACTTQFGLYCTSMHGIVRIRTVLPDYNCKAGVTEHRSTEYGVQRVQIRLWRALQSTEYGVQVRKYCTEYCTKCLELWKQKAPHLPNAAEIYKTRKNRHGNIGPIVIAASSDCHIHVRATQILQIFWVTFGSSRHPGGLVAWWPDSLITMPWWPGSLITMPW
jgi:hypothetical protein